jgi:hypothetical protein
MRRARHVEPCAKEEIKRNFGLNSPGAVNTSERYVKIGERY